MPINMKAAHRKAVNTKKIQKYNIVIALPLLLILLLFTIVPFLLILGFSLVRESGNSLVITIDNFVQFVTDANFWLSLGYSLYFAVITTIVSLLIGYPVAYFIARVSSKVRNALVLLVTAPMWVNMLLRTIAWKQLLDNDGIIVSLLNNMGFSNVTILGTDFAIVLGLVYVYLPFVIIPIYSSLGKIDKNLLEASMDLGAGRSTTFFKVTLPLSIPGVISAITMVLLPATTSIVIPKYMGNGLAKYNLIGNLIETYFIKNKNNYAGSAISLILVVVVFAMMFIIKQIDRTVVKDREGKVVTQPVPEGVIL